jgi:SAM-dependent methyltransferase
MSDNDPTRRFSERASNYALYRPGYPAALLECLRRECDLTPETVVADVGSGTGILTRLFLDNGNRVYAVEPNEAMRREAEKALGGYSGFTSVDGRAEATTLPDHSVDLITAGQAFHWFDAPASRIEFGRVLRPGGFVALVWNARAYQGDPFMAAYEQVLGGFGLGYNVVNHRAHSGDLDALFLNGHEFRSFSHSRPLAFVALWGGFLSASYAPLPGDPRYTAMHQALSAAFDAHQRSGLVQFVYDTHLYFGRL